MPGWHNWLARETFNLKAVSSSLTSGELFLLLEGRERDEGLGREGVISFWIGVGWGVGAVPWT
jgi:hypothetical protein